jgi:hypothetical protein
VVLDNGHLLKHLKLVRNFITHPDITALVAVDELLTLPLAVPMVHPRPELLHHC